MLDIAPYYLTAIASLLGPFAPRRDSPRRRRRSARSGRAARGRDVHRRRADACRRGAAARSRGALATLTVSFEARGQYEQPHGRPRNRRHARAPGREPVRRRVACSTARGEWETVPYESRGAQETRGYGLHEMLEALRAGRPHRASGELGLHVLETATAVLRVGGRGSHDRCRLAVACDGEAQVASRMRRRSRRRPSPPRSRRCALAPRGATRMSCHRSSPTAVSARVAHDARARQRVGSRCEPDRPVVDGERGARREHALRRRRAQAGADRHVEGGPTGIVFNGGRGFCRPRRRRRGPHGSSTRARTERSAAGRPSSRTAGRRPPGSPSTRPSAARLPRTRSRNAPGRARASLRDRLPQRAVAVFDERWHPVIRRGAFVDRAIPAWYAPFGIQAAGVAHLRQLRVAARR